MTWLVLSAIALLLAAPAHAVDDPPGRVGRIGDLQGQVWVYDFEAGEWIPASRNRPATSGDRLQVDPGGRAELRIGSTTLRLDGGTELELQRLDDQRIDVALSAGSVALRVRSNEVASQIEVATPEGRFLPRTVGHYRIDRQNDTSYATAWSGELRFEAHDSALAVTPGRRIKFWQDGADRVTHYSWFDPERDPFAEWVARANIEDDRSAIARYVSPEMTGYEDLDRNGRWTTHPEYGAIWIPTLVVGDWAPYRYGHWAFIRPWGWTWVDDAPWGFAPFHYGRWVYWRNAWGWAPGPRVAHPVYAPALVAWVGGPQVSVGVSIGGSPSVGWVPLAPHEVYWPNYRYSPGYLRNLNGPHWRGEPPQYRQPGTVPTGPIMYANTGVPGAVTVVPSATLTPRVPVARAATRADPALMRQFMNAQAHNQAPPPPSRVVAVPGGAVPAKPSPPVGPIMRAPQARPPVGAAPAGTSPPPAAHTVPAPTPPSVVDLRDRNRGQGQDRPTEHTPRRQIATPPTGPAAAQPPTRPQVTAPVVVPPVSQPARQPQPQPTPAAAPTTGREAQQRRDDARPDRDERQRRDNGQRPGPRQQVN
jgi:hypothetical protein